MTIFDLAREQALVHSIASTLGWDQETYMPPAANRHRSEQLSWLSARAHELATSPAWQRALEQAEQADDGSDPKRSANLRELRRQFDRETKLPTELVARESKACSLAKQAWAKAREENDFPAFEKHLDTLIAIAREKADLWGYRDEPYDALLECYERNTSTAEVASLFDAVAAQLRDIAAAAVERSKARPISLPAGPYPIAAQQRLNTRIAEAIGIDFQAARIDTTAHPFCTKLGPEDQRLTTRYDEADFTSSLFGVLHEAGHGHYEMSLPTDDFGLPSGTAVSLGIHESQSRLWENHVGRSRAFWEFWYPAACDCFPQLKPFPLDDFLAYLWRADYSPIRVEADEATYDLHILLRFDLERRMLRGELLTQDIPDAWHAGFESLFGFRPANDRDGCLQDIHWSMGGLGYFPTYSLGNFNAAQLHAAALKDPAVANGCRQADYLPLLGWMRQHVHAHGALLDPADLIRQATGEAPQSDSYLQHLQSRYL